jgi:arsenical pump membrane protein
MPGDADGPVTRPPSGIGSRTTWLFAMIGLAALAGAVASDPSGARAALQQDWPPFVLVTGLLLVGLVADGDGVFAWLGGRLAGAAPGGLAVFAGATVAIAVVTAVLNLDTSVAFLTPVLVYTARSRGRGEAVLLTACILLSNAGSLFLPGSNLTNLIVLGHLHLTGSGYLRHMWAAALAALVLTALVAGVGARRQLGSRITGPVPARAPVGGVGAVAIVAAAVLVLVLRSPALAVLGVGVVAVATRVPRHRLGPREVVAVVGGPMLPGLFGVAVALGTLGRAWSGPSALLSHLDAWGVAALAAAASVLLNNLPAASLLAAHAPPHPFALLVGLDVGPNLFVSGSLAWFLWLRSAATAGARAPVAASCRRGLVAVPLAMAAALGALALTGSH